MIDPKERVIQLGTYGTYELFRSTQLNALMKNLALMHVMLEIDGEYYTGIINLAEVFERQKGIVLLAESRFVTVFNCKKILQSDHLYLCEANISKKAEELFKRFIDVVQERHELYLRHEFSAGNEATLEYFDINKKLEHDSNVLFYEEYPHEERFTHGLYGILPYYIPIEQAIRANELNVYIIHGAPFQLYWRKLGSRKFSDDDLKAFGISKHCIKLIHEVSSVGGIYL